MMKVSSFEPRIGTFLRQILCGRPVGCSASGSTGTVPPSEAHSPRAPHSIEPPTRASEGPADGHVYKIVNGKFNKASYLLLAVFY